MRLYSFIGITLLLFCLTANTCSKEDEAFKYKGNILGVDTRKCACFDNQKCGCCGFWLLEIEGKTYIFKELPANTKLDLQNAKFPIEISLDFHVDPDSCAQSWNYIIIDRFKLNK